MHERIKEIRKKLNLTQQMFANRIGVKRNTVATYEMGRSEPSNSAISLICREFGIDERWLRTGEGDMLTQTPQNIISTLATEYNLDDLDKKIVECYLKLGAVQRKVIKDYLCSIVGAFDDNRTKIANEKNESFDSPTTQRRTDFADIDIDAELSTYHKELLLQKKAQERSSASDGQNADAV